MDLRKPSQSKSQKDVRPMAEPVPRLADNPPQGSDVWLEWPFKDCVLEGGGQKRPELFFHQDLHRDEIHHLLTPRAMYGAVRHTVDGPKPATLSREDNLVIHGDNLLALASLRERYKGQVKCIYIDPPYNTGNTDFGYNDRFHRFSWLTFMKNRLELSRELLTPDGAIYVQLDYNQVHYAKIMMDEIFGAENFQNEIIWRIGWVSGYKTAANNYIRNHDTILFYAKDASKMDFHQQDIPNREFLPLIKNMKKTRDALLAGGFTKDQANALLENINRKSRPESYPIDDVWNASEYDDLNSIAIVSFSGESVSKMLGCNKVKGQKSEKLIARILEQHTRPGDLVLDFFSGTGTTAAVAHKMGRRYIVCEQLNSNFQTSMARLDKVIAGEQSGVSARYNWQGGGSFISYTLLEAGEHWTSEIQKPSSTALSYEDKAFTRQFYESP